MMKNSVIHIVITCIFLGYSSISWCAERGEINPAETKVGIEIVSPSFSDTWTFQGEAGDRVIITAVSVSGLLNTVIYLHSPNGDVAADTSAYGDKLDCQLLQTGEYTVVVQDYGLNNEGYYNMTLLKISGDVIAADDFDGGMISSGETLNGRIIASDLDSFQFYGDAGDRVIITAVSTSGSLNTVLFLYPPNNGPLEADTGFYGDRLDHQLLKSGQYTIVVQDSWLSRGGYYNISFLNVSGDVVSTEDQDGGAIFSGETLSGRISASDLDAFQFHGDAGDRVIINGVSTSGALNTVLYLYPPDNGSLEADTRSSGDRLDHQLMRSGQYTVIMQDSSLSHEGYYNITLIKIPGDVVSAKDADGGAIASGETLNGRIIASDLDAFQFHGDAGDRVIITAVTTSGDLNTALYLYPPDSGPLESSTNYWGDKLDHQLMQAGQYTVVVQDMALGREGYYNITFLRISGNAISTEGSSGRPITTCKTLSGRIVRSNIDAFHFNGVSGDQITITATKLSGSLNTEIYLYPPNGFPCEAETNPWGDTLDHRLMETGKYTIVVQDFGMDDEGYYRISLDYPDSNFSCPQPRFPWGMFLPVIINGGNNK